jgi:F-type H+-transporting ATPase subunit delta
VFDLKISERSKRYAQASLKATPSDFLGTLESEISSFIEILTQHDDLLTVFNSPIFTKGDKLHILQNISKKAGFSTHFYNGFSLFIQKGRAADLFEISHAFIRLCSQQRGEILVSLQSAYPISAADQEKIKSAITHSTGHKPIIRTKISPDLLGGIRLKVGSILIDDTIKGKLDKLQREIFA